MSNSKSRVFKHGDIYPAHVLRDQYGMNAENRPFFKVAEEEVPEGLRELIPQVERWAIPCDVTRHDYFYSQPEQDISDFYHAVLPYVDLIHAWLHAQPKNVADWPRAAVHYMYFLKAHSEAYQPTEDELQARAERLAARQHTRELEGAIAAAEDAFRSKNYNLVVRLLAPFDRELDKIWTARLALARNRTTPNDVTVE